MDGVLYNPMRGASLSMRQSEVDMRFFLIAAAVATAVTSGIPAIVTIPAASAAECTGENCPPPDGQGGHDCDREKQDQTTS
jgi:hypothetical protein